MKISDLRTLGRSGLLVSPLSLGTMTFGTPGWGTSDEVSQSIFNAYVDAGGNSIDTADVYAGGRSEELVGQYIAERRLRDHLVLATKYSWNGGENNPLAGGNGRKNLHRALEGSLKRLQTDCIDLYWMHVWDRITPVEEVLQALGELVRAGKIRYFGFSVMPCWVATRAATLAQAQGAPGPIAMQMAYSLIERNLEHEYVPAARELGMGVVPWSPLGAGFLTGKYKREDEKVQGAGRLSGPNPFGDTLFTPRNWKTLDALREVAGEADLPLAQVALAWVLARPGVASLLIGATKMEQLQSNIASLELQLSPQQTAILDAASAPEPVFPYGVFSDDIGRSIFGGANVQGWR